MEMADEIDVNEAKGRSECYGCERTIYVYNQYEYPKNFGPICFDCLRKEYEKLRDGRDELIRNVVRATIRDAEWKLAMDGDLGPSDPITGSAFAARLAEDMAVVFRDTNGD